MFIIMYKRGFDILFFYFIYYKFKIKKFSYKNKYSNIFKI